jgi:hypothetical protein
MRTSRKRFVTINSLSDLLGSFLVDVPPDYRFEPTRLQIYPIGYFLPFLRVPTPLNAAPFSYLILQRKGSGVVRKTLSTEIRNVATRVPNNTGAGFVRIIAVSVLYSRSPASVS